MSGRRTVLTVHVLDTFAEEGVTADAAVISELGGTPSCVATGILAGSPAVARAFAPLPLSLVELQIDAALAHGSPAAIRVGFVSGPGAVERVAELIRTAAPETSVLAPVVRLLEPSARTGDEMSGIETHAFPDARVLVARAGDFAAFRLPAPETIEDLRSAAGALRARGARAALVTGLVVRGRVFDLLDDDGAITVLDTARVQTGRVRGLAGAHAAALATHLAGGMPLSAATEAAQRYVGFRLQRGR